MLIEGNRLQIRLEGERISVRLKYLNQSILVMRVGDSDVKRTGTTAVVTVLRPPGIMPETTLTAAGISPQVGRIPVGGSAAC